MNRSLHESIPGVIQNHSKGVQNGSRNHPWRLQNGLLGASWEALGGSWELLEHLGSLLEAPDGSEERLLVVLEGSWKHLGASWSALGDLLEALGGLLGASWSHFRSIWRLFGRYFGAWKASSTRFVEIMKNHQKHCKVLQKSRIAGPEFMQK